MSENPNKPDNACDKSAGCPSSDENLQKVHAELLHGQSEPKEGATPLPLFLLGFITVMIFVATLYIVNHRGGFSPMVYDGRFDPATATKEVVKVDPVAQGKRLFEQTCAACHQATGLGIPTVYPPLAGSPVVQGDSKVLVSILLHGLTGPLVVESGKFNGNMPDFGSGGGYNWNDAKIAYVLTYVRQAWGNKAAEITADEVTKIHQGVPHGSPWTMDELNALK